MAEVNKKQLAENKELLAREEEAQRRRIALRRQEEERRRSQERRQRIIRNSYMAILWFAVIAGLFIAIAWFWPTLRQYVVG